MRYGELERDAVVSGGQTYALEDIEILSPTDPSKIVCVGLDYLDHAEESGMEVPDRPLPFLKLTNAVAAHGDEVLLFAGKERVEYDAETGAYIAPSGPLPNESGR